MKKKLLFIIMTIFSFMLCTKVVYAASASITANKTSVTVGTKVTVTVKITAATWNLKVAGEASDSIVGFNSDAENQTTTKTYSITPTKAGTYTVSLTGDITDGTTDVNTKINRTVTITAKEKTTTNTTTNTTTDNTNTNTKPNTTTVTKSSNANISRLTLSVEGLSFKSNQTTYNIKVGADVEDIKVGVTLAHKKATYTVTGNKGLKAGNNVIKIVVIAENGTKKTYKINVDKAGNAEDTSAELSNLIIENMTFETPFNSTETEYIGSKMKYAKSLNVLPYPVSEKAKYEIIGNDNLKEGKNTIIIKVTSYDESSIIEYKVDFEMMAKEETNALHVVSPYVENAPQIEENKEIDSFKQVLIDNSTIILLYLLALIEFAQVIYLYVQLKSVSPDVVNVRRKNKKESNNRNQNN